MNNKKFYKKFLIVLILVFMAFTATACDFSDSINYGDDGYTPTYQDSNDGTNTPTEKPKDNFPAIPVYKQTTAITEKEILGSDFFSSKQNYFNVGKDMRYVNLKEYKTVYIRYEQNLDSEVKQTLDDVITYLQNVLKVDPSYKLVYDSGTPGLISDLFTYDTIYIKNPDNKVLNDFKTKNAAGITYSSNLNSPVIYVNKSVCDIVINGKNIEMARVLLHEIMHGFGFPHTLGAIDLMSAFLIHLEKVSTSSCYYNEPGTGNRIFVKDYLFFSNDELAGMIGYFVSNKSYSEKLNLYKNIGGTLPDLNAKFEEMKSNFIINTRTQSTSKKSPDFLSENQIVAMKDKTNTFEIIINKDSIGTYTCILSNGTSFTGISKIMSVSSDSSLTNQIICLTDFQYEGKTRDITLYAFRNQDGDFYQRWKVYDEIVNLVFTDNTANYFA